jgi:hypothetical protein
MTTKRALTCSSRKEYKISENAKREIKKTCDNFIELGLKPEYYKSPKKGKRALLDINSRWRGKFIYFIAVISDNNPDALSPQYEEKFARLEYRDKNHFSLAYLRHTGEWFDITYGGTTLNRCLEMIKEMTHFDVTYWL